MNTNEYNDGIKVIVADASHEKYVDVILQAITDAARQRGSGIASRTHEYLATKMKERKAVNMYDFLKKHKACLTSLEKDRISLPIQKAKEYIESMYGAY